MMAFYNTGNQLNIFISVLLINSTSFIQDLNVVAVTDFKGLFSGKENVNCRGEETRC